MAPLTMLANKIVTRIIKLKVLVCRNLFYRLAGAERTQKNYALWIK